MSLLLFVWNAGPGAPSKDVRARKIDLATRKIVLAARKFDLVERRTDPAARKIVLAEQRTDPAEWMTECPLADRIFL
ncbi:MAG TPA: hypothetical protein VFX22_10565, partial [Candidatus Kapabacteria bacterium]|nr:hypothetical protein [Candidatus Kapabacteria bacterium]